MREVHSQCFSISSLGNILVPHFDFWQSFQSRIQQLHIFTSADLDSFADSVETDETAHSEGFHQDLHCLLFRIFDRHEFQGKRIKLSTY